jgi:hypothetical protein
VGVPSSWTVVGSRFATRQIGTDIRGILGIPRRPLQQSQACRAPINFPSVAISSWKNPGYGGRQSLDLPRALPHVRHPEPRWGHWPARRTVTPAVKSPTAFAESAWRRVQTGKGPRDRERHPPYPVGAAQVPNPQIRPASLPLRGEWLAYRFDVQSWPSLDEFSSLVGFYYITRPILRVNVLTARPLTTADRYRYAFTSLLSMRDRCFLSPPTPSCLSHSPSVTSAAFWRCFF